MGVIGEYTHRDDPVEEEDGTFVYGAGKDRFHIGDVVSVDIPVMYGTTPGSVHEGIGEVVAFCKHDEYYTAVVRFLPWLCTHNWRSGTEEYSGSWLTHMEEVVAGV